MPRRTRDEPDDDDPDGSDEYDAYHDYDPEDRDTYPSGLYDDDGPPLVPCRYCGQEIFEDAEQCPRCGNYHSAEDSPAGSKSRFWVVMMVLALLAAAFWTLAG